MAKNEKSLWDTKKRKKKLHYGNPEEKEKGTESIAKAIREMDIQTHDHEAQRTQNGLKLNSATNYN